MEQQRLGKRSGCLAMTTLGSQSYKVPTSTQPQTREKRNSVNSHCLELRCPVLVNIGIPRVGVQTTRYQIHGYYSASQYSHISPYKQITAAYAQRGQRTLAPLSTSITYVAITSLVTQPSLSLNNSNTSPSHKPPGTAVN